MLVPVEEKYKDFFAGKRITVMGLGLLGRGVGDAAFLAECGAEVLVTDLKNETDLESSVTKLKAYPSIAFVLGEHRIEDFTNCDLVLVAAGVPMDSPYLAAARKAGVRLAQSAALFAELSSIPTIGITGTRGKSTVTLMIHHGLSQASKRPVLLGGNIRGVSNLQLLKEVNENAIAVLELDSWQLQGFGWAKRSPHIAVFTNLMPDHLNYYKGDMDAYFADKANIFLHQHAEDVFITTPEIADMAHTFVEEKGRSLPQDVRVTDASHLPNELRLQVPGEHNRLNAALAYEALRAAGLSDEEVEVALASFSGAPGRLQFLREIDGVRVYNDNNATTPEATLAALQALHDENKRSIVLIMGGADKGIDMHALLAEIPRYCKKVILLPGTGTDRIRNAIDGSLTASMEEAVAAARAAATSGDTILFSPGFASFGLFKNEYDRNDQFVSIIEQL